MFIIIPPWDVLVAKFGLDEDGDVCSDDQVYWSCTDEELLPLDRIVEIEDIADEDGDYRLLGIYQEDDLPTNTVSHILKDMFNLCERLPNYGTSRFLRRPYATD